MNNFKLEVHFNFALFVLLDENKEAVSIITQQKILYRKVMIQSQTFKAW